jgi:putative SOS response-associated peptidase YedK
MPIILNESELAWWLGEEAIEGKELITRAASPDDMECYPVTRRMSNSRYTLPDCIEKISLEEKQLGLSL